MGLVVSRATIKPDSVDEIEAYGRKIFAAVEQLQPPGFRYATCKLADGVSYLTFIQVEDGAGNPLPAIPEAREFQSKLKDWLAEPATTEKLTVFGSYRLF